MAEKYVVTQQVKKVQETDWDSWWTGFWSAIGMIIVGIIAICVIIAENSK